MQGRGVNVKPRVKYQMVVKAVKLKTKNIDVLFEEPS